MSIEAHWFWHVGFCRKDPDAPCIIKPASTAPGDIDLATTLRPNQCRRFNGGRAADLAASAAKCVKRLYPRAHPCKLDAGVFHQGRVERMAVHSPSDGWIGTSLLRKEDARHLLGHGMFIADIRVPGLQEIAFVRSQMAHARVRQITVPADAAGRVFTLADLGPLNILEAGPEL